MDSGGLILPKAMHEASSVTQLPISEAGGSVSLCGKTKLWLTLQMSLRTSSPRESMFSQDQTSDQSKGLKDGNPFTTAISGIVPFRERLSTGKSATLQYDPCLFFQGAPDFSCQAK